MKPTEARLRAVLAALLDPTVVIDDHGVVQAASDSVERDFGYAPKELVGQNVSILMTEPHRSEHDGYLERYRRTGRTWILGKTREFEVVRKDGSHMQVDLSVSRADLEGEGPLFIGSFRDVTERKRAEQAIRDSERRFHAVFDQSFQFVGLLAPDGTVLEANDTACRSVGVDRESVVGKPFWETAWWSHSAEVRDKIRGAVGRAAAGEFVRFEVVQRGRGGAELDVDFSLKPVRNEAGEVVLLIPEGRDVTEVKAAQRAETAMLRSLATIGESAAVLAHEIKNPITAVHVALRAVADKLGEDEQAVLEDLVARMKHLEQLMRRTLSFARALQVQPAECDVRELLERTVDRLGPAVARTNARVEVGAVPTGLHVVADANLCEDLLSNLVTNAIESRASGVRVVVSAASSADQGVLLAVDDDGPGIPCDRRDSVFKPFVTSKPTGTGLGLAICRKIAEAHGGTLDVEDSALGGCRFVLRLPAGA